MNVRLCLLSAAVAALFAIGAGCGSGSSNGTESTGQSGEAEAGASHAQFVKTANAVCAQEREKSLERVAAFAGQNNAKNGASKAEQAEMGLKAALLATVSSELKAVGELQPPAEDEDAVEAMLANQEALLHTAFGRQQKMTATELEEFLATKDGEMRALGLTGCARG